MKSSTKSAIRYLFFGSASLCAMIQMGCVSAQYTRTAIGQAFDGEVRIDQDWGQILCAKGKVCAEVEVDRVDIDRRDAGRVEVNLHNRTGVSVIVQIALEIYDADKGAILDRTTYQNVPVPPRQYQSWTMPGIYRKGAKVRVLLRPTAS